MGKARFPWSFKERVAGSPKLLLLLISSHSFPAHGDRSGGALEGHKDDKECLAFRKNLLPGLDRNLTEVKIPQPHNLHLATLRHTLNLGL